VQGSKTGVLVGGLHLTAVSSLAVAQQYFEPLGKSDSAVGFGMTGLDLVVFAVLLVIVPPLALVLLEAAAGLVSDRLRWALHLVFLAGLVALIAWQAIHGASGLPGKAVPVASLLVGAAAAFLYARASVVRTYATVLSFAPLLVLFLFLVASPMHAIVFGGDGAGPASIRGTGAPLIMVIFDELPLTSLMDRHQRVDGGRYPAFARLAADSTWYRNTTSVADYTERAVPAILTGDVPRVRKLQIAAEYPRSIFTLLGGSYRLDVSEYVTELCGKPVCGEQAWPPFVQRIRNLLALSIRIPAVPAWIRSRVARRLTAASTLPPGALRAYRGDVRRHLPQPQDRRFDYFVRTIRPSRGKTFNFLHVVMPHRPWVYLPTGQQYRDLRSYFPHGSFGPWSRDARLRDVGYQRHLLEVEFVDRLLGRLLRRLHRTGLYDRALIVVVADHGASFRLGDEQRVVSDGNVQDVASVPLFIKAPHQSRPRIDDSYVETIDVLPTIARMLRLRIPWKVDGRPAGQAPRRRSLTMYRQDKEGGHVTIDHRLLERRRARSLERRFAIFRGRDPFLMGPRPDLVGQRVRATWLARRDGAKATLDAPGRFLAVSTRAPLPADVSGTVAGGAPGPRRIAVAVNNRIRATGWTLGRAPDRYFTIMVPARSFHEGRNRVEVFAVLGRGPGTALVRLS
jgi:hypothetical protein